MLRSRLPSLIIGVLLIVAVAGIVFAFSSSRRPPEQRTSAVRQVMPPPGALDLRQVPAGVRRAAGYTRALVVVGAPAPDAQLPRERPPSRTPPQPGPRAQ